jgi:hypothetical protein
MEEEDLSFQIGLESEDLSFQIELRAGLRTLGTGALGADAEALPSDQRDFLITPLAGATGLW